MDLSLFEIHRREFFRVHHISLDLDERMIKLAEEVKELLEARTHEEKVKEAADVGIVLFSIFEALEVQSPLFAMYQKLVETAAREEYRNLREEGPKYGSCQELKQQYYGGKKG